MSIFNKHHYVVRLYDKMLTLNVVKEHTLTKSTCSDTRALEMGKAWLFDNNYTKTDIWEVGVYRNGLYFQIDRSRE